MSFQLIKDVCRSIENLVKCGDKILPHCLEARNVNEINDAILYKMENLLDSLKVRPFYNKHIFINKCVWKPILNIKRCYFNRWTFSKLFSLTIFLPFRITFLVDVFLKKKQIIITFKYRVIFYKWHSWIYKYLKNLLCAYNIGLAYSISKFLSKLIENWGFLSRY